MAGREHISEARHQRKPLLVGELFNVSLRQGTGYSCRKWFAERGEKYKHCNCTTNKGISIPRGIIRLFLLLRRSIELGIIIEANPLEQHTCTKASKTRIDRHQHPTLSLGRTTTSNSSSTLSSLSTSSSSPYLSPMKDHPSPSRRARCRARFEEAALCSMRDHLFSGLACSGVGVGSGSSSSKPGTVQRPDSLMWAELEAMFALRLRDMCRSKWTLEMARSLWGELRGDMVERGGVVWGVRIWDCFMASLRRCIDSLLELKLSRRGFLCARVSWWLSSMFAVLRWLFEECWRTTPKWQKTNSEETCATDKAGQRSRCACRKNSSERRVS